MLLPRMATERSSSGASGSRALRWRGKPILSAQQIEDAVAYLVSLKEPPK